MAASLFGPAPSPTTFGPQRFQPIDTDYMTMLSAHLAAGTSAWNSSGSPAVDGHSFTHAMPEQLFTLLQSVSLPQNRLGTTSTSSLFLLPHTHHFMGHRPTRALGSNVSTRTARPRSN